MKNGSIIRIMIADEIFGTNSYFRYIDIPMYVPRGTLNRYITSGNFVFFAFELFEMHKCLLLMRELKNSLAALFVMPNTALRETIKNLAFSVA